LIHVGFEGNHSGGKVTVRVGCCTAVTSIQYKGMIAADAATSKNTRDT
jgi:hypothetical protein